MTFRLLKTQVNGLAPTKIPVKFTITGCPLNAQLSSTAAAERETIVRFGSHLEDSATVKHDMRINNTSSHGTMRRGHFNVN